MEQSAHDQFTSLCENTLAEMHELKSKLESTTEKLEAITKAILIDVGRQYLTRKIQLMEFEQIVAERIAYNGPGVAEQSAAQGLELIEPDRKRCTHVGPVVGLDHRAALIKWCSTKSIELPFSELGEDQIRPVLGDLVRMDYRDGKLEVTMRARSLRSQIN